MTALTRRVMLAVMFCQVTPALSQSAIATLAINGIAIQGYDPVAYFVEGAPRQGRAELSLDRGGVVWRFASEANRERFRKNPARYLPAYSGYCAYGVSQGYLVPIDPVAWTIINDQLYLNYDLSVRDTWLRNARGYIAQANRRWPGLAPAQTATVMPNQRNEGM
jgi:YHS domain-containing protein